MGETMWSFAVQLPEGGFRRPTVPVTGRVSDVCAQLTEQDAGDFYPKGDQVLFFEGTIASGEAFNGKLNPNDLVKHLPAGRGKLSIVPHHTGHGMPAGIMGAARAPSVRPSSDLMAEIWEPPVLKNDERALWDDYEARKEIGAEMKQHEVAMAQDLGTVANKIGGDAPDTSAGWACHD